MAVSVSTVVFAVSTRILAELGLILRNALRELRGPLTDRTYRTDRNYGTRPADL
jgi:hypothetical protein